MMKLSLCFATLLLTSHAATAQEEFGFVQNPWDYSFAESPIELIAEEPAIPAPEKIDLDILTNDFILDKKKIDIPGHPFANNPSITRWKGKLLLSFRTYNMATRSTNPFGLIWLDEDFNPIGEPQIFELPFKNPVLVSKQQDPRLIAIGDRLFAVYNNILENVTHKEMRRMCVVEFQHDGNLFTASNPECITKFESENEMRYEKNWVPFDYNGELRLGYSIIPHKIFRPILGTNSCETVSTSKNTFPWNWGPPRGGTQAVLDGDHYLGFFHSWVDVSTVQSKGKKITHYVMGAYIFEAHPPFNIIAASPEPIVSDGFYDPPYYKTWKPLRCVFPSGLIVDENYAWVAYGRQDHEVWIAKIDKKKLIESLVPTISK
jgi:predicted GH43/DUF377 family glycosyl hydrolase